MKNFVSKSERLLARVSALAGELRPVNPNVDPLNLHHLKMVVFGIDLVMGAANKSFGGRMSPSHMAAMLRRLSELGGLDRTLGDAGNLPVCGAVAMLGGPKRVDRLFSLLDELAAAAKELLEAHAEVIS